MTLPPFVRNPAKPGTDCVLTVTTASGATLEVLTLTREQALHCWRGKLWGQTRLVMTDDTLIPSETDLHLHSTGSAKMDFALYPDTLLKLARGLKARRAADGIFARYRLQLPGHPVAVTFTPCDQNVPPMSAELAAAPQPGPQYNVNDLKYRPLPGSRNWRLSVPPNALTGLNNVFLQFNLTGDTAALYLNDKLVDDWFIYGPPMTVGLKNFASALAGGEFKLQLLPLTGARNIFWEDPELKRQGLQAELKGLTVLPEYEVTVQAATK